MATVVVITVVFGVVFRVGAVVVTVVAAVAVQLPP